MTCRIRPFTDTDYDFLAAVDARVHVGFPRSAEQFRHADRTRDPDLFFERHVIEVDGEPVACGDFGHTSWIDDPDKYWFQVLVPRETAGGDIRAAYLDHALATLASRRPTHLVAGMLEDYGPYVDFLARRGFAEVHREHLSRLDLVGWDPAEHQAGFARVAGQGIGLATLAKIEAETPDWQERLHPVYRQLVADQPAPDPPRLDTLEEWRRRVLGSPDFDPGLWVIARDGMAIVGLSQAAVSLADPTLIDCGLTGVVRSHRRRGIATAMKTRLIEIAQGTGAATMVTGNEAANPMYTINLGLGFEPEPDWVMLEKQL